MATRMMSANFVLSSLLLTLHKCVIAIVLGVHDKVAILNKSAGFF